MAVWSQAAEAGMEVGFIGLGRMGSAMARNLAQAGHAVRAWNRSSDATRPVDGVRMAASPAEAFQADAVFTMLSDDPAIRDVLIEPGILRTARPGLVHVVTATISVAFADELLAAHDAAGLGYVSAPVFGRPEVAEAGQLNVMAAGRAEAVDTVRPLLEAPARKVWVMGTDPKQANAAKIVGNMMITMAIEAMAEAVALTSRHGLAAEPFLDLILHTLFAGRSYELWPGSSKQPVLSAFNEEQSLASFADICTHWTSARKIKEGEVSADLFGFLTADANAKVHAVHSQAMPVLLTTAEVRGASLRALGWRQARCNGRGRTARCTPSRKAQSKTGEMELVTLAERASKPHTVPPLHLLEGTPNRPDDAATLAEQEK